MAKVSISTRPEADKAISRELANLEPEPTVMRASLRLFSILFFA